MASGSIKHDVTSNGDTLRFGLDSVKGEIVGSHPLESLHENSNKFWEEKKKMGLALTYGSSFNLRKDLDAQILARTVKGLIEPACRKHVLDSAMAKFQRPTGALPSSMLGFEALTGALDDFGFEDYLNLPQNSESFRPADMHHGMEVRLGISKGPVHPSFL